MTKLIMPAQSEIPQKQLIRFFNQNLSKLANHDTTNALESDSIVLECNEVRAIKTLEQTKPVISVLIGLSGGLDSVALLDMMVKLKRTLATPNDSSITLDCSKNFSANSPKFSIASIRAIYIHHGLSDNADDWATHCQTLCADYQIELIVERVHVNAKEWGIEAGARAARYLAFQQHLLPNEVLLTAQHLDDQAETFLLALKRGSGPLGLGAMAPVRQLESGHWHARPLISLSRQTLEQYAQIHHLKSIHDESNDDDTFDRNFLRLNVMPILQKRWPHFNQSVAKSAELCHDQERLLDELLLPILEDLFDEDDETLAIEPMIEFSPEKRFAILRRWCHRVTGNSPTSEQIRRIWHEVALSREDSHAMVEMGLSRNQGAIQQVRRYQNRLYLVSVDSVVFQGPNCYALKPTQAETYIDKLERTITRAELIQSLLAIGASLGLSHDMLVEYQTTLSQEEIIIRFELPANFKLAIIGQDRSKTVKKIWQIFRIPPWQRQQIPFIFVNDQLIMAKALFLAKLG